MWLYCAGCVACIIGISRDVINSNLSELVGRLKNLITFTTINTIAPVKTGFQTIAITTPTNTDYIWHRIDTACNAFVNVMNGTDAVLSVESIIQDTINVTFVSTFIGVKKL